MGVRLIYSAGVPTGTPQPCLYKGVTIHGLNRQFYRPRRY